MNTNIIIIMDFFLSLKIFIEIFLQLFYRVGQYISTKAVGTFKREDITDAYKFPERK